MAESKGSQEAKQAEPGASGAEGSRSRERRRWRPYVGAFVAVAAVFAGSALIGAQVRAGKASTVEVPTGVATSGPDTLSIPVHPTVPVTLTVFEDLRSRESRDFAREYASTFDSMLASGQVQIAYRLVTQSDARLGGTGSAQAANAAACAQDQGRDQFRGYVEELWRVQPDPSSDSFASASYLEKLAHKVKGLRAADFEPCVQDRAHQGWVAKSQHDFAASGLGDVPVVEINGQVVPGAKDKLTPAKLRALVAQAVKQAEGGAGSAAQGASPAPSVSPSAKGAAKASAKPSGSAASSVSPKG